MHSLNMINLISQQVIQNSTSILSTSVTSQPQGIAEKSDTRFTIELFFISINKWHWIRSACATRCLRQYSKSPLMHNSRLSICRTSQLIEKFHLKTYVLYLEGLILLYIFNVPNAVYGNCLVNLNQSQDPINNTDFKILFRLVNKKV